MISGALGKVLAANCMMERVNIMIDASRNTINVYAETRKRFLIQRRVSDAAVQSLNYPTASSLGIRAGQVE